MDFITARKEYNLLKQAYITGAITEREFLEKIDTELEVTAEDGTVWKIDEDSGIWMVYLVDEQVWAEMPDVYPETAQNGETKTVKIDVPAESPQVPAEVYSDWKTHVRSSTQNARSEPGREPTLSSELGKDTTSESSSVCQGCGNENRPGTKFCTRCGKPLDLSRICPACGKKLREENKFCTGCGQKID